MIQEMNASEMHMDKIVIGILAHVDAGKTTLSEALLYETGSIRRLGRVDHRDAFLDTHSLERARGITIFSKQAAFQIGTLDVTLLDTPGHADLSTEMERTLQVLDCAILVISGTDGVQAHTETLWRLLRRRRIPVFLFINKMDLPGADRAALLAQLRQLDEGCLPFDGAWDEAFFETLALSDEALLERYMRDGTVSDADVRALVAGGRLFPCCFGAALRLDGVQTFLQLLSRFAPRPARQEAFGAKVFKIGRDSQGARLTYLKVTGGTLRPRMPLTYLPRGGADPLEEKVAQLRLYAGEKFTQVDEVPAGSVCAVLGLSKTWPGQGLGTEAASEAPTLEPVLTCRMRLPEGCDARAMLPRLLQLEEEDPMLHLIWNEQLRQIQLRLMGEVQMEVLQALIAERFGLDVTFDEGRILYLETIAAPVEGVGHFEPLRHYAEVHLLLEPGEPGSGLSFASDCSEDMLDRNWQRLILTHLEEKTHFGVLTGSPVTDLRITLKSGRAHIKHTEGGDFRQATYRAVRQGLMQAKSILLEPCYRFRLTVQPEQIGRAIHDLRQMNGTFSSPTEDGGMMTLSGVAPVSALRGYGTEVASYTRGRGRLSCSFGGYQPCHNSESVIAAIGYDPEADPDNTPDSVFCAHGGGFHVKWCDVPEYMHLESCLQPERMPEPHLAAPRLITRNLDLDEKQLQQIIERQFGPQKTLLPPKPAAPQAAPPPPPKPELLIVDGYNLIYAWPELKAQAADDLPGARSQLIDLLANYRAMRGCELILVFDAYKVPGNPGQRFDRLGIRVAFTRANETGDLFIEKLADEIGRNYRVRVVTSDNLIRLSALRSGVLRVSSQEFFRQVEDTLGQMRRMLNTTQYPPARIRWPDEEGSAGQEQTQSPAPAQRTAQTYEGPAANPPDRRQRQRRKTPPVP